MNVTHLPSWYVKNDDVKMRGWCYRLPSDNVTETVNYARQGSYHDARSLHCYIVMMGI